MDDIEKKLDALLLLRANWDSYGALPVSREIMDAARQVARVLPGEYPLPYVAPTSNGGVQFEWHRGNRTLELELEDAKTIHFLQWDSDEGIEEEDTFWASDVDKIVELIRWFAEEQR